MLELIKTRKAKQQKIQKPANVKNSTTLKGGLHTQARSQGVGDGPGLTDTPTQWPTKF